MKTACTLGFLLMLCALADKKAEILAATQTESNSQGNSYPVGCGHLFIPTDYKSEADEIELVVHFHGSAAVAQKNLRRSNSKALLVTVMLNGLSAIYTKQFSDPNVWNQLLSTVKSKLIELKIVEKPTIKRVSIISFSAGFGGVRELLKHDAILNQIDAIVMADSIYAGYLAKTDPPQVDPKHMEGFLKFAREAAAGRKLMIITHCELRPEGYASTAETADYILRELALTREPASEVWADGWQHQTQSIQQGLQVHGFAGHEGKHHMQHLHGTWRLLQLVTSD